MAISVRTRPTALVTGGVSRVVERRKREMPRDIYAYDALVETAGGGLYVRYWLRDESLVPGIGEQVALVVSIEDGEQSSLNFERPFDANDLDLLQSTTGLALVSSK